MSEITHPEMVTGLAKNGEDIINELTPNAAHLLHMAVGIAGEAGELCEAIYKTANFEDIDTENVVEELGDIEFYIEGFRQGLEISKEETMDVGGGSLASSDMITVKDKAVLLNIESAILLDFVKKHVFYVKPIKIDLVIISLKKINNLMFVLRSRFGIEYQETIDNNIAKLGERYAGHSYSNKQAIDRADKDENDIPRDED